MSRLWLLDTNILSAIIKRPQDAAAAKARAIAHETPAQLITSVVVECELAVGAKRIASVPLEVKIRQLLQFIKPMPIGREVVAHYALVRSMLERSGTPIGPNDTLIAAHALTLGATVVTDNEAEFSRVAGLQVENWLR